MQKQLAAVTKGLESAQSRLEKLTERITEDHWQVRNDPARWSVAECVAHLNLTSAAYIPLIRAALAEARATGETKAQAYHRDPMGWLFSTMTGPLPSLGRKRIGRVKTMAAFIPEGNLPRQIVLAAFKRDHDELIGMAHEAEGLPIDKVRITSPFGGKIRYNCYSAFVIIPRHDARHLEQAELVWNGKAG
ncbi:MAG TPA: DinB family protein [Gemmatimonadaceae bacterium]|nr:DinB family protein [Gemmatimonadaceae bacterium]